jgi:hypothetical protein
MNDERLRILKMVEEAKISAEEAAQLLEAIEEAEEQPKEKEDGGQARPAGRPETAKVLKVRVFNSGSEEPKVNLTIPMRFVGFIKNMIPRAEKEKIEQRGFDLDDLVQQAEQGSIGTIMDIEDEKDGERVQITIE